MKKLLLTLILAAGALLASAQSTPHAIGFHMGGSTLDLEYQYHFNQKNFLDVTAGIFDLDKGFLAQGVYNWNIRQWSDWTPRFGTWKFWGGVGAGIGFVDYGKHDDGYNGVMLGPVGTLGFGFTLKDIPLSVGLDYRPMVAIALGDHSGLVDHGFRNIGLTMTYRF